MINIDGDGSGIPALVAAATTASGGGVTGNSSFCDVDQLQLLSIVLMGGASVFVVMPADVLE